MKNPVLFLFVLSSLMNGCCCSEGYGYDGGGSYYTIYSRKIKLTDTLDRILKISYKNSDKIFYPNDTIADLIISDNSENMLFVETKKTIDTIVLRVQVNYEYRNEDCSNNQLSKQTNHTPKIVNHTFQNAFFDYKVIKDSYNYNTGYVYDVLTITP